jgi:hypothetical protein
LPCLVLFCLVLRCLILSSLVLSACLVFSCYDVLSCLVASRRVVSCRVVSCRAVPCRACLVLYGVCPPPPLLLLLLFTRHRYDTIATDLCPSILSSTHGFGSCLLRPRRCSSRFGWYLSYPGIEWGFLRSGAPMTLLLYA